ncbi:YigZ family protein [Paraglaciecola aquimarina]|uniref:YigZ family protein n=1 Tax=Paraglaciecola aquimarina TaxID=1235557 RepID=A0ABU3SU71_9ALTE|nr:YigZ family protein [Paraglaciecola aquimarina]MDU0353554.1 YigZ family protein [Paraglaciecola aquimarina]
MKNKAELSYAVPAGPWHIELEVKRSKFLTLANNASSRQEADDFVRSLRELHPQASHVCWAYIAGAPNTTVRSMSDDGEPSGTAGMPMLKVLEHSGLGDIVVAVVRYFGGTKLGTGGLQRAYSDAVAQVLSAMPTKTKVARNQLKLSYDYEFEGAVTRLIGRYDVENIQADYAANVVSLVGVASSELGEFKAELINITSGRITIFVDGEHEQ